MGDGEGPLANLIRSPRQVTSKVKALRLAEEARDPAGLELARALVGEEPDSSVRAQLVHLIGVSGDARDAALLTRCLDDADGRVVAVALEALQRLGIAVSVDTLARFVDSGNHRVRAGALAALAVSDPERVFDTVAGLLPAAGPELREALANLLGELGRSPRAREILLGMLSTEKRKPQLRKVAAALRRCVRPRVAAELIGPLYRMQQGARGTRQVLIEGLLRDIGTEVGWAQHKVKEVGEEFCVAPSSGAIPLPQAPTVAPPPPEPISRPVSRAISRPVSRPIPRPKSGAISKPVSRAVAVPAAAPSPGTFTAGRVAAAVVLAGVAMMSFNAKSRQTAPAAEPRAKPAVRERTFTFAEGERRSSFSGSAVVAPAGPAARAGDEVTFHGRVLAAADGTAILADGARRYRLVGDDVSGLRVGAEHAGRGVVATVEGTLVTVKVAAR